MNENQDLLNLLGRIHQLVDYGIINIDKLNEIQSFCDDEISRLDSHGFIEKEEINWNNYKIREQSTGHEIDAGMAMDMTNAFSKSNEIAEIYKEILHISYEVATDLFKTNNKLKIFLGADRKGLVFLYVDEKENKYYILDNKLKKEEIIKDEFDDYKKTYNDGLKSILDRRIQQYNSITSNTERFILFDTFYAELERLKPKYPNLVVSFHPAIHISDDIFEVVLEDGTVIQTNYKHRLTFIMILGYYQGAKFIPISGLGAYDRNGLCPPGC
ncbi:hypothetical protein [Chryseobacterium lathyri]|uniref:Uncharacterized protein n=1 Tax=Chryseobacterium lathyri TaxID=395933 RepID=A0ABT9SG76_9FLAO|nr:hypothetical protein [Chryseobacterium lathyri]MDP9958288.1 hypothetical protein [Chryseobacterium lathyri]MDQ0066319.1 hypothetical protein [Chryseobacterium lathyri]